jgi:hypothetical protein
MKIAIRQQRRAATALLLLALTSTYFFTSSSASAMSPAPGWELYSVAYPTNFGHGVDAVQEVTTEGSGTFTLTSRGAETAALPDAATGAEVQAALEALSTVGPNNVSVNERSPGNYVLTFVKDLGSVHVRRLEASGASVSVIERGAASGTIGIDVFNIGAAESSGPITVTDTLPAGIRAKEAAQLVLPASFGENFGVAPIMKEGTWDCTGNGSSPAPHVAGATIVTCQNDPTLIGIAGGAGTPTASSVEIAGNREPRIGIVVEAVPGTPEATKAGSEGNHVSIVGGGASESASTVDPITVSSKSAPGGITQADAWLSNEDGTIDRQAGSHPYAATFIFSSSTALDAEDRGVIPGSEIKDLETEIPPGLLGDLHSVPQCTRQELLNQNECPPSSMVGRLFSETMGQPAYDPVFNMVPPSGVPAELGFFYEVPQYISFSVKTGSNDSIVAHANNLPGTRGFYEAVLQLWGVPQDSSHDKWRDGKAIGCSEEEIEGPALRGIGLIYCHQDAGPIRTPFLSLPTSCGEPGTFAFRELSGWQDSAAHSEASFLEHDPSGQPAGVTGCERLQFEPAISTALETSRADTPTGLTAEVKPPVGALESLNALRSADLQDTTVVLPPGLVINPGQAAGLQACGAADSALTTASEKAEGRSNDGPASCPEASKIGTVTIKSPLVEGAVEKQFEGDIYVLQSNPPDIRLLVAASADGVNLKLVGDVSLCESAGELLRGKTCEAPGQLITTFQDTPQLPFTDFKLSFEGGAKAALDTPTHCGTYTSNADFTPWSNPFAPDFLTTASFSLVEGPGQGACPATQLPFAPSMTAGTSSNQAGGFASFSMLLQRDDGTQRLESFRFTSPAGLAGLISSVPPCPEPQAAQGACPSSSEIGHATTTSGAGAYPLTIPQPGQPKAPIYLTGPYHGAPYGLSIVTPVIAGPFNLGTIVTRAKIEVDPHTAQVTVATDPLPQIVKGVPTDLRSVYAVIDRPGFFFNPTNCERQQFTGSVTSAGAAASAPVSSSFGIGGCRELAFAPKFSASTQGNGLFNRNGASLNAKISTKQGPQSNPAVQAEANIKKVDVQLPVQLPSRLVTLQKACTEKQFATNPAGCPEASNVGSAVVHTPVLPGALVGPAYLVSHGSAAFPDLDMVLQGDGVTIVLTGGTDIKKGVTFSRFETVPDAPISSFELNLPERKFSALAANGNLCKPTTTKTVKKRVAVRRHGRTVHVLKTVKQQVAAALLMPTTITAQNGAVFTQTTKIAVTGCPKAKAKAKKKVKKAKRKVGKQSAHSTQGRR